MTDTISKITTVYESNGADKAAADFARVTKAQDGLAQSSVKVSQTNETLSRSTISVQRQIQGFAKANDDLTKAEERAAQGARLMAAAQREGLEITAGQARALANAQARVAELRAAVEGHTASVGLNRNQMLESVHVMKSFADQVIAGQSPLRALAVEGGRIGQIFTSGSGGVGGTIKALGVEVASLATGWVGLGAATAGAAAVGVLALVSYTDTQHKLAEALEGTGRAAGMTVGQLDAVARAGAIGTNLSPNASRDLAATYAHAGFSGGVTQSLIGMTPGYGRATGQETGDAAKALADAFADPLAGFGTLDKSIGSLDDRLRTTIRNYEDQGRLDDARKALSDGLNHSLNDTIDHTTRLSRAFEAATSGVGGFMSSLGSYLARQVNGPALDEQIAKLQARLGSAVNSGGRASGQFVRQQASDQAELSRLLAQRDAETKKTADAAARADASRISQQAGDIVRSVLPQITASQSITNQVAVLRAALANPDTLGVSRGQTVQALSNLTVQQSYSDPTQRMVQDNKLAIQSIEAFTLAERVAVEARRAELEVLRETGDLTKAAVAAEAARNLEIAKANNAASDRLDQAKQDAALVGLSPFQRGIQDIKNRYEGVGGFFAKDSASASELSDAMKPVANDLRSAGTMIVDALHGVAGNIRGATPGGGSLPTFAGGGAFAAAPANIQQMILSASMQTGISAGIVAAIGQKENGFRLTGATGILGPDGRPASTAWGYGQLTNGAAKDVASVMPGFSKFDPDTAVLGAAKYLQILLGRNHGDMNAALDAYGGTPGYGNDIARRSGLTSLPSTSLASDKKTEATQISTFTQEQQLGPIDEANKALKSQVALLDAQKAAVGRSAAETQGLIAAQQLTNQYTSQGIPITNRMAQEIKAYGDAVAAATQAQTDFQERQQTLIQKMDAIRTGSKDALSTFVSDLRNGAGLGKAFSDVLDGLLSKALDFAENAFITGLFGKAGTTGGGLLAGVFHEGGVVGAGGSAAMYPAGMWRSAPRYHSGLGLGHDERPAILQTGEVVVSRQDLADARRARTAVQAGGSGPAGAAAGAPVVNIINQSSGAKVSDVKTTRGPDGRQMIHATIQDAVLSDLNNNGKIARTLRSFGGVGRTG